MAWLIFVLASCGGGDESARGGEPPPAAGEETTLTPEELTDEETAGELTEQEPVRANDGTAGAEGAAGDRVEVGGFTVGGFDAPDVEVPRVTATQEDALEYLDRVEPIIGEGVRDVSEVVRPQARVENGQVELGVDVAPVEEARAAAQQNLERLRQVRPPEGGSSRSKTSSSTPTRRRSPPTPTSSGRSTAATPRGSRRPSRKTCP